MSGSAVLTGTEHCAAQEGIDPWEQQVSQSLPLLRVWPLHAWVIASPILLDPSVAAYVSAGPCRRVARINAMASRRRCMVQRTVLSTTKNVNYFWI